MSLVQRLAIVWLAGSVIGLAERGWTEEEPEPVPQQQMDSFTLSGYDTDGTKRWDLEGTGAHLEGEFVTIANPRGVGHERADGSTGSSRARTSYLTASLAHIEQTSKRVRLEHDVTIHTSDGLWLTSPVMYWLPDRDELTTELPARLETDQMLLRGRGATGYASLKQAVFLRDVELVMNPSSDSFAAGSSRPGERRHVVITCDGPLTFDHARHIAIFEQNVHLQDGDSDLYSDQLVAYLSRATRTIRYAEALGRVRIWQGAHMAVGRRAVYEPAKHLMTLLGAPSLRVFPDAGGPVRNPLEGLPAAGPAGPRAPGRAE